MARAAILRLGNLLKFSFIYTMSVGAARIPPLDRHRIKIWNSILLFENLLVEPFFFKDVDRIED